MGFETIRNSGFFEIYDEERNIRLRRVGGIGRGVDQFELDWDGDIVKFDAYGKRGAIENNRPISVDWTIYTFVLPDSLMEKREEAKILVKEALEAYGYKANKDWHGKVTAKFSPKIKR